MPAFRCILVAADFSDRSRAAFDVAVALAHETKTRMFVLHVAEPPSPAEGAVSLGDAGIGVPLPAEGPGQEAEGIERLRDQYAARHAVDVAYIVRSGVPAAEILRGAAEVGADLIVMGTHGRTGLRRLLAGSVAEAVLRQATCPVLTVSTPEVSLQAEGVPVLLHPTDFSEGSKAALKIARTLARDHAARLVLAHVMPVEVVAYGVVPAPLDIPALKDELDTLAKGEDGPDLEYPVETHLLKGDAATEVLRLAESLGCRMIVMGTHGRTGLGRLLMGSVAEKALRAARCPVLTVRPTMS